MWVRHLINYEGFDMDLIDYKIFGERGDCFYWFAGRRELLRVLIKKYFTTKNAQILNIGCGTGEDVYVFEKFGKLFALDIAHETTKYAKRYLGNVICSDAQKSAVKSDKFDLIIISDVLEHIPNDLQTLNEITRLLKKNGQVVITVPAIAWLYSSHDAALQHLRRYSEKRLKQVLKYNNLHIIAIGYWNVFIFLPLMTVRLLKKIVAYSNVPRPANIPRGLNRILMLFVRFENYLIAKGIRFPVGTTLFVVAKKSDDCV